MPKKPNLITQTQFAKELKVSKQYIGKLVSKGVVRLENGKVNRRKALIAWKNASDPTKAGAMNRKGSSKQEQDTKNNTPSSTALLSKATADEKKWKAKREKLKYQNESGELVNRKKYDRAVLAIVGSMVSVFRKHLIAVPTRISRKWDDPKERKKIKALVSDEIREAMESMSSTDLDELILEIEGKINK